MRYPAKPPNARPSDVTPAMAAAFLDPLRPVLADGRYLHWDELRRRPPPSGLTREQWWFATKMGRVANRTPIPGFFDESGRPFWFCSLDAISRATHELDRRDAARVILESVGDEAARKAYRSDQLIEEAISSSLIEGARITTRAEAKAMIRDRRPPTSRGERMVLNNFHAMSRLLELSDHRLTLDDLLEIHAILGDESLDVDGAEGRLRTTRDDVHVVDAISGDVWHTPPDADTLPARLDAMLAFANGMGDEPRFVHPLLRAIVLHFWLAYLHPFVDGNGRMARAIFYWQMLRSKYDFAQYLSISGPIDRSKRAYYMAFAHSETDDGDLTYFLLNQLAVLRAATNDLLEHLHDRTIRMRELARAITSAETLNHRQRAALDQLMRAPHDGVLVNAHARIHGVSYLTARKDLQDLEAEGLLRRVRAGRTDRYLPSADFVARVRGSEA